MLKFLNISSIAKLVAMTPDAVRFYEKKKIINPERKDNSNYREFSIVEVRRLFDCKTLKDIEFALSEIDFVVNEASLAEVSDLFTQKEQEIEAEIREKQLALSRLRERRNIGQNYHALVNSVNVQECDEDFFVCYAKNNELNDDLTRSKAYENVMKYYNLFKCTVMISTDNLNGGSSDQFAFGFSTSKQNALDYNIDMDNIAKVLPKRLCVYTVITSDGILDKKDLEQVFGWMDEHNFIMNGDIIGKVLNVVYDHGVETRIYGVWIPCGTK